MDRETKAIIKAAERFLAAEPPPSAVKCDGPCVATLFIVEKDGRQTRIGEISLDWKTLRDNPPRAGD